MDQFFGDPACWQLGAAGIRLRSGETHVSPVSQSIVTSSKWEGVNTVMELKVVFTLRVFTLNHLYLENEINLTLLQEKSQMWSPTGISNRG